MKIKKEVPVFGARLRKFLLLSVLCCLAFSSSADVILTDKEYEELLTQLDNSEKIQKQIENPYDEADLRAQQEADLKAQREAERIEREGKRLAEERDLDEQERGRLVRESVRLAEEGELHQRQRDANSNIRSILEGAKARTDAEQDTQRS